METEGVNVATTAVDDDPSVRHLLDRLGVIEARVHAEVTRRRADGADPDDRFRGLYVSDARVDQLFETGPLEPITDDPDTAAWLVEAERDADENEAAGARLRLRGLRHAFGLDPLDVELLLVALAPDLDQRFEPLYGYLNDDVSLRRATVGMALQLCGASMASGRGRARLGSAGPLVRAGLLTIEAPERPMLTRSLRVPDRVVAHLLGDDTPDAALSGCEVDPVGVADPVADHLARALQAGATFGYLVDHRGAGAAATAVAALTASDRSAITLDLSQVPTDADLVALALAAGREARLRDAGLVAGPVDVLVDGRDDGIRAFADTQGTVLLYGAAGWDPTWSTDVPVVLAAERISDEVQADLWSTALGGELADGVDPVATTAQFRLTPGQIRRAATAARQQARASGRPITDADVQRGARSQNAAGLQRLARRVEPTARWDDLIVPAEIGGQLRELASRWRHRDQVLEGWAMGRGAARGRGVSALFAGGSGTGKTLASEVIAGELGLDLYLVDLSTVVDKYIGETSKNLERIFDEADRVNGVLLFDEADALFGKRSAVSDAKDRHANVEVAFLLQRMETFDGVAILTTNLAANLDDAFMRRLDAIVDFPSPDEHQRQRLWRAKLQPELPQADDVDVELLADRFRMSGSEIRNVVVSAAYRAADEERPVTMEDLVRATIREHRKIGRQLSSADLGEFRYLLEAPST